MKISIKLLFISFLLLLLIIIFAIFAIINSNVTNKLDGVLWTIPAKVYARPLVIAEGTKINRRNILKELFIQSYEKTSQPNRPGEYSYKKEILSIFLRGFDEQNPGLYGIKFNKDTVVNIKRSDGILVAIGAPNNDGNGPSSGHVRVYQIGSNCAGCTDP